MKDEELDRIAESVPAHLRGTVAFLARECARLWTELADRVERKGQHQKDQDQKDQDQKGQRRAVAQAGAAVERPPR
jgi:hypothetical protein